MFKKSQKLQEELAVKVRRNFQKSNSRVKMCHAMRYADLAVKMHPCDPVVRAAWDYCNERWKLVKYSFEWGA